MPWVLVQFHPFVGVGVDDHVPVVDLVGMHAHQHGQVAGHHQPLDVVGVGVVVRRGDTTSALTQAMSVSPDQ